MRKWEAIIWMEDTPPEGEYEHLQKSDVITAIEKAKAGIEKEWEGLKVTDFDVYVDYEIC